MLPCKIRAVVCYRQCPDTTTSFFYLYSCTQIVLPYVTSHTMQPVVPCKLANVGRVCILQSVCPVTGHWLFLISNSTLRHWLPQRVSSLVPKLHCSVAGGLQGGEARQQVTTTTINIVRELFMVWILGLSEHNCSQC